MIPINSSQPELAAAINQLQADVEQISNMLGIRLSSHSEALREMETWQEAIGTMNQAVAELQQHDAATDTTMAQVQQLLTALQSASSGNDQHQAAQDQAITALQAGLADKNPLLAKQPAIADLSTQFTITLLTGLVTQVQGTNAAVNKILAVLRTLNLIHTT